jgi:hypothetical protein
MDCDAFKVQGHAPLLHPPDIQQGVNLGQHPPVVGAHGAEQGPAGFGTIQLTFQ